MSEEIEECPNCGHSGPINDFEPHEDAAIAAGALQCPECDSCIWDDY